MPSLARAAVLLGCLSIAACGSGAADQLRSELGLNREAPDEFTVVTQAPLTIPPNFTLRPPEPGAVRPQELAPEMTARRVVFGSDPEVLGNIAAFGSGDTGRSKTPGEIALLQLSGADQADPEIRRILDQETSILTDRETSFVDRLLIWKDPPLQGSVVDAQAEQRRIRENAATGDPLTQGETPTIERRRTGILEGLF